MDRARKNAPRTRDRLEALLGVACMSLGPLAGASLAWSSGPAAASGPQEVGPEPRSDRAFVEVELDRQLWYVGERIPVRIRFGVASELQPDLQPLFPRKLDLPLQVLADWAPRDVADARGPVPDGETLVLNDGIARARPLGTEERAGGTFATWELTVPVAPDRAGTLTLAGTTLRLAYATSFREDLFVDPVALDTRIEASEAAPVRVEVAAPPEDERPIDFTGAIGNFSIAAEIDRSSLSRGEVLRVTLRIDGEGNFGLFEPPEPRDWPGFELRSGASSSTGNGRVVRWELVAREPGDHELPPLRLSYFDPGPPDSSDSSGSPNSTGRYFRAASAPLRVSVLPGPDLDDREPSGARTPSLAPPPAAGEGPRRDANPLANEKERSRQRGLFLAGVLALGIAAGVAAVVRWRGSAGERAAKRAHAEREERGRAAARRASDALAVPEVDVPAVLCAYLATRLDCTEAAVVDHALARRLGAAGLPGELSERAGREVDAWVGARFGGPTPAGGAPAAAQLVADLESAFAGLRP